MFIDAYTKLMRGNTVLGQHLPIQLVPVSIDLILESDGAIPIDSYDLVSFMWTQPTPKRADYFIDEATQTSYQVEGAVKTYQAHVECRVTKYAGVTP